MLLSILLTCFMQSPTPCDFKECIAYTVNPTPSPCIMPSKVNLVTYNVVGESSSCPVDYHLDAACVAACQTALDNDVTNTISFCTVSINSEWTHLQSEYSKCIDTWNASAQQPADWVIYCDCTCHCVDTYFTNCSHIQQGFNQTIRGLLSQFTTCTAGCCTHN